jgi:hypothetical protein
MSNRTPILLGFLCGCLLLPLISCSPDSDGDSDLHHGIGLDTSELPKLPEFEANQWRIWNGNVEINAADARVAIAFLDSGTKSTTIESEGVVAETVTCADPIDAPMSLTGTGVHIIKPRFGSGSCSSPFEATSVYPEIEYVGETMARFRDPATGNTTQVTVEMDGIEIWDSSGVRSH